VGEISNQTLLIYLALLIICSGFFSGSETGMMAINRYRLRHMAKTKKTARRIVELLERPDRLLGVILIGNTFANILSSAIATIIAVRLWGESGVIVATIGLTFVLLIFAEIMPKTVAAIYPESVAYPVSLPLKIILKIIYPIVWVVSGIANTILRMCRVKLDPSSSHALSKDELRTMVHETSGQTPRKHQTMLLRILDLEKVSVEDIMVPRSEVIGIDLEDNIDDIISQIIHSQHTYLPVYKHDLDQVIGILHVRHIIHALTDDDFSLEKIHAVLDEPYFIPENTPLQTQLLKFQRKKRRNGLVVNEYGDIQGLATLEDILEEIVGEFTTDMAAVSKDVHPQKDGTFLVDGSANIRDINRSMNWQLPADGPKTISGLITEHLENIPAVGTCMLLNDYPIEVVQLLGNTIKTARIGVKLKKR